MKQNLTKDEIRAYEIRLRSLVDELSKEAQEIPDGALGSSGEIHSDRGDEAVEEAAIAPELGVLAAVEQQLSGARSALTRIAAGSFGTCTVCSRAIPRSRLELIPFASECADCARRLELGVNENFSRENKRRT